MAERAVVLVTGSSGLIGSAVSRGLLENYSVVGFDREGGREPPRGVEQVDADVTDEHSLTAPHDALRGKHGTRIDSVEQFIFSSTMLVHAPTEPARPMAMSN